MRYVLPILLLTSVCAMAQDAACPVPPRQDCLRINNGFFVDGSSRLGDAAGDTVKVYGSATFYSAPAILGGPTVLGPYDANPGSTGEIRFMELAANGTNYLGFKAADVLAGSVVWTLPVADGGAGAALTTSGSGVLSWSAGAVGTLTSISQGTGVTLTPNPITTTGTVAIGQAVGPTDVVLFDGVGVGYASATSRPLTSYQVGNTTTTAARFDATSAGAPQLTLARVNAGTHAVDADAYMVVSQNSGLDPASGGNSGVVIGTSFPVSAENMFVCPAGTGIRYAATIHPLTGAGNGGRIRLRELAANGGNFAGFKAADSIAADITWTLPSADGTANQVLKTDGSGVLSFATDAGGTVTSVATGTGLTGGPITTTGTISISTVPVANGGTGEDFSGIADGALLIGDDTENGFDAATLTATANQTTITNGAGSITIGTVQDIGIGSAVTFSGVTTSGQASYVAGPYGVGAGNTGEARFKELTAGGSNYVGLKAADALAGDVVWTLPTTDGTNGQPLSTNGSGTLAFGTLSVAAGGTGGTTALDARTNLQAARSVTNGDILQMTSLENVTALQLHDYGANPGETSAIAFYELTANGSNYVGLKGPDLIAANKIWTLPAADGTNGQLLSTNGSGALSWAAPTSSLAFSAITAGTNANALVVGTGGSLGVSGSGTIAATSATTATTATTATLLASTAQNAAELSPYGVGAGNTGEIRFLELAANGTNYRGLKAADLLTGDLVWTLPASDGTNGQPLTTNGSGVLSFGTLGVAAGGTGGSAASITLFNNITGFTAAGATGTTSTNLVFSTSPTLVTPAIGAATGTSLQLSGLTASEILITDGSKNIVSAAVATYPSLTELSYGKGVTSAIQTQLDARLLDSGDTSSGNISFSVVGFGLRGSTDAGAIGIAGGTDVTLGGNIIARGQSHATIPDSVVLRYNATNRVESNATGLGFFAVAPVAKPGATDDLRQAMINLGLYTTGGATPLNLNGGALSAAGINATGEVVNAYTYGGDGIDDWAFQAVSGNPGYAIRDTGSATGWVWQAGATGGMNFGTQAETGAPTILIDVDVNGNFALPLTTSLKVGTIELGHATDTTLARVSAGVVSIEGNNIYTIGGTDVAVADGGTGLSTLTQNGVLYGNAASAVGITAQGAANTVLTANAGAPSFSSTPTISTLTTTGQGALSIGPYGSSAGNTSELRMLELAANGTSYVGFKAADALAANKIWTLPIADGTNGQTLSTNGSGTLAWATAGTVTSIVAGNQLTGGTITTSGTIAVTETPTFGDITVTGDGMNTFGSLNLTQDISDTLAAGLNIGALSIPIYAEGDNLWLDGSAGIPAITTGNTNFIVGSVGDAITSGSSNTLLRGGASVTTGGTNYLAYGGNAITTGSGNIAIGTQALNAQTTGGNNVAIGAGALKVATCELNVAVGTNALDDLTTDALGDSGPGSDYNAALGFGAGNGLTTGAFCTFLGPDTAASGGGLQNSIALGATATITANNQLVVGGSSAITNAYFGSGVTAASPIACALQGTSGSGTDIAGANLTVASGRGTGTGASGSLIFQTATAGTTGSSLNALATRLTIGTTGELSLSPIGTSAGNTNEIRFLELAANGTNYVGLKSPDSVATNRIWTLPAADGTVNQVLTTDGSGALSFANVAATAGGTGQTSYAVGDLLYASTTTALSKLADVATGSVLVSGGIGVAPAYSATPTVTSITTTGQNRRSVQATITAFAGGGQASAVELTGDVCEISVVGTTGDSVKFVTVAAGYGIFVVNHGANSADVFPATGDSINEAAVNTAKTLAADASMWCVSYDSTNWECVTLAR